MGSAKRHVCSCGRPAFYPTSDGRFRAHDDHPNCRQCHRAARTSQGQRASFMRHSRQDSYLEPIQIDSPRLRVLEAALIYFDAFIGTQREAPLGR